MAEKKRKITPEEQAKREQRLRSQGMFEGVRNVGYPGEVLFIRHKAEKKPGGKKDA